jgi:hypothetical protein
VLYFAIPAYNEAETIGVLLWQLRTVMAAQGSEYEVLVYDDASTDATRDVLGPYTQVLPLTVLGGQSRRGTGGALDQLAREAVRRTRYPRRDAIVFLQGDFTDRPDDLPELLKRFAGGADLVAGERSADAAPPPVRRVRTAERWLVRRLVRIPQIEDLTSTLRVVRLSAVKDALNGRNGRPLAAGAGAVAWLDLLLSLVPHARRVDVVPVTPEYTLRSRASRLNGWPDAMALVKYAWANRGGHQVTVQRADAKALSAPEPLLDDEDDRPRRAARISDEDEAPARRERQARGGRRDREARPRDERPARARPGREPGVRVDAAPDGPSSEAAALGAADGAATRDTAGEGAPEGAEARTRRRRRKRGERRPREVGDGGTDLTDRSDRDDETANDGVVAGDAPSTEGDPEQRRARKKRRRRKRRPGELTADGEMVSAEGSASQDDSVGESDGDTGEGVGEEGVRRRRSRSRRGRGGRARPTGEGEGSTDAVAESALGGESTTDGADGPSADRKRRRRRRGGRRPGSSSATDGGEASGPSSPASPPAD